MLRRPRNGQHLSDLQFLRDIRDGNLGDHLPVSKDIHSEPYVIAHVDHLIDPRLKSIGARCIPDRQTFGPHAEGHLLALAETGDPLRLYQAAISQPDAAFGSGHIFRDAVEAVVLADKARNECRDRVFIYLGRNSICWIFPPLNTAMRSDMVSASPWSWVT